MKQLKNLTPHPLAMHGPEGVTHLPVDGPAPRLAPSRESLGAIGGLPVVRTTLGSPSGLPDPEDGVVLIVSALVAEHPALAGRTDLAYPGEAIRDADGRIIGARGLCAGPGLARKMEITLLRQDYREAETRGDFQAMAEVEHRIGEMGGAL